MRPPALVLVLATLATSAAAQPDPASAPVVGTGAGLHVSAGPATVVGGGFGDAWRPTLGGAGRLDVKAYGGRLRAALTVVPFEARDAVPEFLSVGATLGWGPGVRLPGGTTVSGGPLVGGVHLRFDDDDGFGGNLQNETEALVGAFATFRVPVAGRVDVWADAEVWRVALAAPRAVVVASGGVAVRLGVPPAVRRLAE